MAGLVFKELKYRGLVVRTLIVVPGHLRYQWLREMKERFGEEFVIVDRQIVNAYSGRNVWQELPQVITSLDFAKQEDISASLREAKWDLVIIDEAHDVTVEPKREKGGIFQIEWVPARLRHVSTNFKNRYGEVKTTYRNFTFRKELAKGGTVEFVAPRHPLLESVRAN